MDSQSHHKHSRDEDLSTTPTHSSFSLPSPATNRRKFQRRLQQLSQRSAERRRLMSELQHIRLLPSSQPYHRLNAELLVAEPDPLVIQYSDINAPPIDNFDRDSFTFVQACTPVEMAHLRHFDRPIHTPDAIFNDAIGDAVELVSDLLELPYPIPFPSKDKLAVVRYWPMKFAGIEYARMGLKTRAAANIQAQKDAEDAYDKLLNGELVPPHDVRLGGRGKVAQVPEKVARDHPPPVGRLILMLSHRDLKICGITENQLTLAYSPSQYPIAVGLSWYHGGSTEFITRMMPYEEWFCFDAKKFDSSINPWMVRVAINIVRAQYDNGMANIYDAYWQFVYNSLVEAPIYRDDGTRFQKYVGTTSGHSHNTLLQSIITIILGYACLFILHPDLTIEVIKANSWMESLGDDNLMAVRGPLIGHSVEEIAKVMGDSFNVDWSGKKSFKTTRVMDEEEGEFQGIQFLGKFWKLEDYPTELGPISLPIPYRPTQETYLRLLFPEYGDLTLDQAYLRALGNYIDAAGNTKTETWLSGYIDWLQEQGAEAGDSWPANFKRMVSRDYSNIGVEVPKPMRITRPQWLDLTILTRAEYVRAWGRDDHQEI